MPSSVVIQVQSKVTGLCGPFCEKVLAAWRNLPASDRRTLIEFWARRMRKARQDARANGGKP